MALITLNPMFTKVGGRMGSIVHYNRLGTQCVRRHVIPRNPDSAAQRLVRDSFRDAVALWQVMPMAERKDWNRRARYMHMSGYNLFISRYMKHAAGAVSGDSAGDSMVFPSRYAGIPERIRSVPSGLSPADRPYKGCNPLPHGGNG